MVSVQPTSCTEVSETTSPAVRIRTSTPDPFAGLRGHDYIKARNLSPHVQRVQTSAQPLETRAEVRK